VFWRALRCSSPPRLLAPFGLSWPNQRVSDPRSGSGFRAGSGRYRNGGNQFDLIAIPGRVDVAGELTLAIGTFLSIAIPTVGGDPIGAFADAGGAFDIGLRGINLQKGGEILAMQGRAGQVSAIDPQHAVLVVANDEQVTAHRHGGGGISHAIVPGDSVSGEQNGDTRGSKD